MIFYSKIRNNELVFAGLLLILSFTHTNYRRITLSYLNKNKLA